MENENPLGYRVNTIGNGAGFPIIMKSIDNPDGSGSKVESWQLDKGDSGLVKQNLISILTYQIGERMRQERFGCRLWECLEEPNTNVLQHVIKRFIADSISSWEPRIKALSVSISRNNTKLLINIKYQVELDIPAEELNFEYNPNNI